MDTFRLPAARFLSEQKGTTEAILTARLSQGFAAVGLVRRAYLARVTYETDPTAFNVVLAIRTTSGGEERALLPGVDIAFASIFGPHEHLDVLFVREDQESEIMAVCQPFYSVTETEGPIH